MTGPRHGGGPMPRAAEDSDAVQVVLCHLTQADLAARWQISPRSLERWRVAGTGPAWLRLGGGVRYRLRDVLAFEEARLRARRPDAL